MGTGTFIFAATSRPALGPVQPPIRWVQNLFCRGVKLTAHLHLVPG